MTTEKTPASTSSDYDAMLPYWEMASAILGGAPAMRAAGEAYLPKFPYESQADYDFRRKNAKFSNIFGDIVSTLSAKPFSEEVSVGDAGPAIEGLIENIDGQGNHLHVFASNWFYNGVASAIDWVLVDYTRRTPGAATVADEKASGARPYWVNIPARNLIAVYSETIAGMETIVHARIKESVVVRDGFGELTKERVRVLDREVAYGEDDEPVAAAPATWTVYEKRTDKDGKDEWAVVGSGPITIEEIPLVPFISGRRIGSSWQVKPPLADAAHLQIEHYQQESGLKSAKESAAFPMLAGNGVSPILGDDGKPMPVPVGPRAVLYAPPDGSGQSGEWRFIEPTATTLQFLAGDIKDTEKQLRELGRQPLTAQAGNITTITAAFAGDKAHTVIEAWAINFKDACENALKLTAKWMNDKSEPVVDINTDFSLDMKEDDGAQSLDKMRERGDISQETYWSEMKRRGVLSANFDADEERGLIIDEMPGEPGVDEAAAAMPEMQQSAA